MCWCQDKGLPKAKVKAISCQHIMHIYMHSAKKAFSSLCIYICTLFIILCFHGGTASSMWYFNEMCFLGPWGWGGDNGVRGPHPHETRLKQRWQPNATSVDRCHWLLFTCYNHLSLFEKHVSEDDGMFTLWVEGFFRLYIYICIKWSKG